MAAKKTSPAPAPEGEIRIEYRALAEFKRFPANPKEHDLGEIRASMLRHGFVMPGAEDAATGRLFAGHGRLDVLEVMKASGEPPPKRIIVRDGEWFVPVICGVAFPNEAEAEAYLLADNKISEIGGWDAQLLPKSLIRLRDAEVPLTAMGFGQIEIGRIIADYEALEKGITAGDDSKNVDTNPAIIIECKSESHQRELLEKFGRQGLKCRALM